MNFREKKNLLFRLISTFLLFGSLGFSIFCMISILNGSSQDKTLSLIAVVLACGFAIVESAIVMKGLKKELSLINVAFNENGRMNNVFLVFVLFGVLLGLTLEIICAVLYCTHPGEEPFKTSTLVIMSIATFLLVNCLSYFVLLIMFKKREYSLKDYAK